MAPFATDNVESAINTDNTPTFTYFRLEDLGPYFRSFMAELESWHEKLTVDFKSLLLALDNFMKEWNVWFFTKLLNAENLESLRHICNEMESLMKEIVQNFETFQTKWKSFQEENSELAEDSAFKTVAEKHTFMYKKVTKNMINIISLASYIK